VNIGGLRFGALTPEVRDRLLAAASAASPTYDHVGSTLDPQRWSAPDVHTQHLDVGTGAAAFDAARTALRTWVPHAGIGARIEPANQLVESGATVLVVLRRGPLFVIAPDRIVAVVDEPRRFAFAYGTLPGHPERGEESYTVEHLDDDTVRATIRVHARAGTLPARAIAPIVRWLQTAALRGYLRAIANHVSAADERPDAPRLSSRWRRCAPRSPRRRTPRVR
jgi:uncharacterized protein (UPF0548 family)